MPDFLQDLYEKSVVVLPLEQRMLVYNLLGRNADVFSQGPADQGCTDLVRHQVDIGDSLPIRQPPRRLPSLKRVEAHKTVTEMLGQGFIEPSTSLWSSPIVLAKKKDGSWRFCVN